MKKLFFGLLLGSMLFNGQAQTPVSGGVVSGIWSKSNSPYLVQGDLEVPEGATLHVEPGTVVLFAGNHSITVYGKLRAVGTEQDSIWFSTSDTTGFSNRYSHTGWGGLRFYNNTVDTSVVSHCILEYGKAYHYELSKYNDINMGGAVFVRDYSHVLIENCNISHNYAYGAGGAIYMEGDRGMIRNNRIIDNTCLGTGTVIAGSGSPAVCNNTIAYNTAGSGGGISCADSAIVSGNLICNNEVTGTGANGAGIRCSGTPVIVNNIIANNAEVDAGGSSHGGGMSFSIFCSPRLVSNNIIAFNRADWGGAISAINSTPTIKNTIFYQNESYSELIESYAILENCIFIDTKNDSQYGATNIYQVDPGFADPPDGVGPGYDALHADWSLTDTSYCINTGIVGIDTSLMPEDILGNPRIINEIIDLGPYEYPAAPKNRRPVITPFSDGTMPPGSSVDIPVEFRDPDLLDEHVVSATSNNANVQVEIVLKDTTSWLHIEAPGKWTGGATVTVSVEDNSGATNSKATTRYDVVVSNTVCGSISENTTWGADTIFVDCWLSLEDDRVLTILPGTVVLFNGPYDLEVMGTVRAIGTESEPILFTARNETEGWEGVEFRNGFHAYTIHSGAMDDNDTSIFRNCTFTYCSEELFYIDGFSKLVIDSCQFHHNRKTMIHTYESSPTITHNLFSDNLFVNYGGSPIWFERYSYPLFSGNILVRNSNAYCGGIYCDYHCDALIINNIISDNHGLHGGAINCSQSRPGIINNTITGNHSDNGGGGLYLKYSSSLVANTILWNNRATGGNGDQIITWGDYMPDITDCVVEGLAGGIMGWDDSPLGPTVYSFDPQFAPGPDNYQLQSSSSCINTGRIDQLDTAVQIQDFYGSPRISDGVIDIGASEFQGAPDPLPPVGLTISSNRFSENEPAGSFVGVFTSFDPNHEDTHSYALVSGDGTNDLDNSMFNISSDSLFTAEVLDHEEKDTCIIHVQTTDQAGKAFSRSLTLLVRDENEPPEVLYSLPDQVAFVGVPFRFEVADTIFSKDAHDQFRYFAHLEGVRGLPSWLWLDMYSGIFEGVPTEEGHYTVLLYVSDYEFISNTVSFWLEVKADSTDPGNWSDEDMLIAYPNPFQSAVHINNRSEQVCLYTLYDYQGTRRGSGELPMGHSTLQLGEWNLPAGIYHLSILLDGELETIVLVKLE